MKLKAAEVSMWNAEFECMACGARVLVGEGQPLPRCRECLRDEFQKVRALANRMIFPPPSASAHRTFRIGGSSRH